MDAPDKTFSELAGLLKSWIPWRSEPANVSRDFWMPDKSCRVCYECDSQFTVFNRRHHCRQCGRVFCAKCTSNSIPVKSIEPRSPCDDIEKIRVCNYCFKQCQQGLTTCDNVVHGLSLDLSTSPSVASLASTKSSGTDNSSSITLSSTQYPVEPYQRDIYGSGFSPNQSQDMESIIHQQGAVDSGRVFHPVAATIADISSNQFGFCISRNDDYEDGYAVYQSDTETMLFSEDKVCYPHGGFGQNDNEHGSQYMLPDRDAVDTKVFDSSPVHNSFNFQDSVDVQQVKKDFHDLADESESSSPLYAREDVNYEPVDFENNGLLWLPPEPDDEDDEKEGVPFEDDDVGDAVGEWGYLRTSNSFGSAEYRNKDKTIEEHKRAMKRVVDGHFRALVSQLLLVENLTVSEENGDQSWLDIIASLSWEAATLLKPDTSKGGEVDQSGEMDPGRYVKVKCIASGRRFESMVVKGVVCKKNMAHRRMSSKFEKPRLLILGGALEYQRVSNHLSSFDTLLQQEMDHLKMAVAKISAHHPDVLLVERSVSRFAQEYLLAKNISLVLNIKRRLLERIARCTGAQIVPSIDHVSSQMLGHCDMFHVERLLEVHGTAGQGGKQLVKTLMYFEGCPKPLGCTILLRGANGDELKKVKQVVQYSIFAACQLASQTSFLADEGATLHEQALDSPLRVALPEKLSTIDRSISIIPGFAVPAFANSLGPQPDAELQMSKSTPTHLASPLFNASDFTTSLILPDSSSSVGGLPNSISINPTSSSVIPSPEIYASVSLQNIAPSSEEQNKIGTNYLLDMKATATDYSNVVTGEDITMSGLRHCESMKEAVTSIAPNNLNTMLPENYLDTPDDSFLQQITQRHLEVPKLSKDEFPPSPSDHQSILVSLSSRCVLKGTVCERSHLFRIKFYGSFDKPLGRFLRDHLFDPSYQCRSCKMSSEAHVQCYTHRQGTLTISVKKLSEILLHGERDAKIWMWHRCLRCPQINHIPPATRRIVMSDAAWGLSFGKFLEISFSNHAAASNNASCGHSLHRDCLRFYGLGKMVACFRYASIDVHSVHLPPSKLDFPYKNMEWVQKEISEVVDRAELLFTEALNALRQIAEKKYTAGSLKGGVKMSDVKRQVAELEGMLQREKAEFEESLQKIMCKDMKNGQADVDILEINRLRRQLIFQSYVWDHRLIYAACADNSSFHTAVSSVSSEPEQKHPTTTENLMEANVGIKQGKGFGSSDSLPVDSKPNSNLWEINQSDKDEGESDIWKVDKSPGLSASINLSGQTDPLESGLSIRRALSEGQFPVLANLSDTLEKAWTGETHPESSTGDIPINVEKDERLDCEEPGKNQSELKAVPAVPHSIQSTKGSDNNMEESPSWLGVPFLNFYRSLNKYFPGGAHKMDTLTEYKPVYVPSCRDLEHDCGARLLLPVGLNETVIPVYDDEPTSIISYALLTPKYQSQVSDEGERPKEGGESISSLPYLDSLIFQGSHSYDESFSDSSWSLGPTDESVSSLSGSHTSLNVDPLSFTKSLHAKVFFSDEGSIGKVKYTVICYYAKQFEALRRIFCPSELNFVRSLSRCKKWGAQGGKSNAFFAKTLDDRFIIKQVSKTELESFIKFAPGYFKYLSDSVGSGSPTCLAKILGIYQVTSKHLKGGKETKMDVLVMENLLFGRNIIRMYDLKGSSRSRYNPDCSGSNNVLLDQNLIEAMPTCPIFVGNRAKRLLERAVWNDTSFLASIDVMDYSLLVGVDEEKHELVLGIIDFMRQYTWDKHLETWVKTSGILGGTKNSSPTVISPMQYKKRFRKAMTTYFLMVPDQWSPSAGKSHPDLCKDEKNEGGGTSIQ